MKKISVALICIHLFGFGCASLEFNGESPAIKKTQKIKRESANAEGNLLVLLERWELAKSSEQFVPSLRNSELLFRLTTGETVVFKCKPETLILNEENIEALIHQSDRSADLLPTGHFASDIEVVKVAVLP